MNTKKDRYMLMGVIIVLISILMMTFNSSQVQASSGGGTGGSANNGQVGDWNVAGGDPWSGSGNSQAWNTFHSKVNPHWSTNGGLEQYVFGKLKKVGNFEGTLLQACKKSQFIWWYGDRLYTDIGTNVHPTAANMPYPAAFPKSKDYFAAFMNIPNNGWNQSGGTVLVCSWGLENPIEPELTFKAKSQKFIYDGTTKTVNGYDLTKGTLKRGHEHKATATRSAVEVGSYPVTFTSAPKIFEGTKDVTSQYKVKTEPGTLTIEPVPPPPGGGGGGGSLHNCFTVGSDAITAITQNDVSISEGYTPSGAPSIASAKKEHFNAAHNLLQSPPGVGTGLSSWLGWKSGFAAGGQDLTTKNFDLEGMGITDTLRRHGGVLNVLRTHHPYTVNVTLCQPRDRDYYIYTDEDGNEYGYWGSWYDVGEQLVESISIRKDAVKNYSYQILGVNCNADGFAAVSKEVNHSLGSGAGSGLLETAEVSGINHPLGKSGHMTGKDGFYKPGTPGSDWVNSCQRDFNGACISDVLAGANNDADKNNNNVSNPLFTHEDGQYNDPDLSKGHVAGHGYPNESTKELVFFRDNNDRTVRAEVWYPKQFSGPDFTTYPTNAAKDTRAKLYSGTPEIEITTINGLGQSKFTSIGEEKLMGGHVNKFNMKTQWASEEGKPYTLGVDWRYTADAHQNGATSVDGYKLLTKKSYTTSGFDVHCQFRNTKGSYPAVISKNPYLKLTIDSSDFNWDDSNAIRTLFSRSVSDRSN